LAFDDQSILNTDLKRLKSKVRYELSGFEFLPAKFTLNKLQSLYEKVLVMVWTSPTLERIF
jgi:hypothetical protein